MPNRTVSLVLFTYAPSVESPRHEYAMKTLDAALKNIRTTAMLKVVIASDGSDPMHHIALVEKARQHGHDAIVTDSQRGGYGKSFNLATQVTHISSEYVLALEDDWELTRDLDLDPLLDAIDTGEIDCIRLGYLGRTRRLAGEVIDAAGQTFLRLDPFSEENHVFTAHPRLETIEYEKRIGPWPEFEDIGDVEMGVARRMASRHGVVWPMNLVKTWGDLFAHIGTVSTKDR